MNKFIILMAGLSIMFAPVAAQSQISQGNPGFVSPNSPIYGLEVAWDNAAVSIGMKKASKVAEERVAEAEAMAAKNNTKGMQKAAEQFGKMAEKSIQRNETGLNASIEKMNQLIANAPNKNARDGMEGALENMRKAQEKREMARSNRSNGSTNMPDERGPSNQRPSTDREESEEPTPESTGPTPVEPNDEAPEESTSSGPEDGSTSDSPETTTTTTSGSGEFDLLVSDAPADISDFDYLNVSFSEARVFPDSSGEDDSDNSTYSDNQTENETDMNSSENMTDEQESNETERENGFRVIQLNESTVDLTQVVGTYAQSVANTELPAGDYNKVELYSSNIDASVNGSNVDVKIPPGKLMITKPFTVSENETTEFVFDIHVVLRGNERNNQGFILRPTISESGVAGKDVEMTRGKGKSKADVDEEESSNSSESEAGGRPENPGSQGRGR